VPSRSLPSNRLALVHGARQGSALTISTADALAEVEQLLGDGPGSQPRYSLAREGAASALARVRLFGAWLERNGWLDGRSKPRTAAINQLERAEASLLHYLKELGCTPSAAARLGIELSTLRRETLAEQLQRERFEVERARSVDTASGDEQPAPAASASGAGQSEAPRRRGGG
jgi:hypothetical protein